jgi:hypothetical protein
VDPQRPERLSRSMERGLRAGSGEPLDRPRVPPQRDGPAAHRNIERAEPAGKSRVSPSTDARDPRRRGHPHSRRKRPHRGFCCARRPLDRDRRHGPRPARAGVAGGVDAIEDLARHTAATSKT